MANFNLLLNRLRQTHAEIASVQNFLEKHPKDPLALESLDSLQRMATQLESEWEESASRNQVDLCRYALDRPSNVYSVMHLSDSLRGFQQVVSNLVQALREGPRKRARISDELRESTQLNFGFTYPGSLGVSLFVGSQSELFGDTFQDVMDALDQFLEAGEIEDIQGFSEHFGLAATRKLYEWAACNLHAKFDLDLSWRSSSGVVSQKRVLLRDWGNVAYLVEQAETTSVDEARLSGKLVGIDTSDRDSFHLIAKSNRDIKGHLADEFDRSREYTVNRFYEALVETHTTVSYSEDDVKEKFVLRNLEPYADQ